MGELMICYAEPGKRPYSVATIRDNQFLRAAAVKAISEAEAEVEELRRSRRTTLARIRQAEVARLRTVLSMIVPGLDGGNEAANYAM